MGGGKCVSCTETNLALVFAFIVWSSVHVLIFHRFCPCAETKTFLCFMQMALFIARAHVQAVVVDRCVQVSEAVS